MKLVDLIISLDGIHREISKRLESLLLAERRTKVEHVRCMFQIRKLEAIRNDIIQIINQNLYEQDRTESVCTTRKQKAPRHHNKIGVSTTGQCRPCGGHPGGAVLLPVLDVKDVPCTAHHELRTVRVRSLDLNQ